MSYGIIQCVNALFRKPIVFKHIYGHSPSEVIINMYYLYHYDIRPLC